MTACMIRTCRDQDLPALTELINLSDRVDQAGFATTVERLAHQVNEPRVGGAQEVIVAESDGQLVGCVMPITLEDDRERRLVARGIVHPQWRRRGVGTALMLHIENRARHLPGNQPLFLDIAVREAVTGAAELALSLGFQPVRYFRYMACSDLQSLPVPTFASGIRLRHYVPGQDEPRFVAAHSEGFADHWGEAPHTLEMEQHRVSARDFNPADNLLAVDGRDQIVGLCVVRFPPSEVADREPPMVTDLAVRPAYRRRGIGRALLLSGMRRLAECGSRTVGLAVDSDNPNKAADLYESVGFVTRSRTTIFRKRII